MLGNLGIGVAVICTLFGVSILYNGMTTSDVNQVLGGGALLSVALVTVFLSVKSKRERREAYLRGGRRGRWHRHWFTSAATSTVSGASL